MLDDFFVRALVASVGVAVVAGPLGCFVIWRRLAYFGDTLAHAALLGAALALALAIDLTLAMVVVLVAAAFILLVLQERVALPSDALLGLLAHASLAVGLMVISLMRSVRVDLPALLFGDVLATSHADLAVIYGGGAAVAAVLVVVWRRLVAATVSSEVASAEGAGPRGVGMVFTLLMAIVIAISIKIVGVLLITALLIIPAAAARRFASGPEQMALLAAVLGVVAAVAGLFGSLSFDTPSGPSIVVAATAIFVASLAPLPGRFARKEPR